MQILVTIKNEKSPGRDANEEQKTKRRRKREDDQEFELSGRHHNKTKLSAGTQWASLFNSPHGGTDASPSCMLR